ncbi:FKBP-type peptidyl-prolyl cis-trans isomerase [Pedobacter sp. ASV12]|uniref:FKBP-type peptidyl-prolyl cis-trans isomerase n=1 Tax=Pedobacter sp. ASV12 TaxID=2795120 RepID=UPI0018ECE158|nr:FKBP-type peptidyl-prolyl cis-trans isomerase [Pedobacter sp. ASV12]
MKKIFIAALVATVGLSANAQTKGKAAPAKKPSAAVKPIAKPVFKTNTDSASYALGLNVANNFKSGGVSSLNYELFSKGLKDVFASANPSLTQEQCQQAVVRFFEEAGKEKYGANINEGKAFFANNKAKSGVHTTASGLQYEVITQGTGNKPKATDRVTVHYKGTLLNGTQFDSSYDRGEPATFGLNQVISGWTEGLQLMPEGSKFRFFIPQNLAYGSRATGGIPPFSALIFEVELIKIEQ